MSPEKDRPLIRTSDGAVCEYPSLEAIRERQEAYEVKAASISRERPIGHEVIITKADPLNWTPLARPLTESTVALVSTGGVHIDSQAPFDVYAEVGDSSSRPIPGDTTTDRLVVSHIHYATEDAVQDINVMFPLDRLRDLEREGVVGSVAPLHYGFMGFVPDPAHLVEKTAPEAGIALREQGVNVVLLTAG